ncbi:DUF5677 domain-containing protein [Vibrio europaeus]|uniref:DUF6988 family protein n=1 Tax=Vibrio europaeus TaxID=300876 RepID=UPI00233ED8A2|nr:DUF5677 domain-containing protein [Vibrio europaeus]MDC5818209.1 DUF5677 domain-containing protein [Vibrio europaeus]MDC5871791.1 DUF5677 domain-containing protein [Vibrio europaeus]
MNCIEDEVSNVRIEHADSRIQLASTLYTVVIDHAQGIRFLIENRSYPSAFALLRVIFETYIRASWFEHCATNEQIESFVSKDEIMNSDKRSINFGQLVSDVDAALGTDSYFSQVKKGTWKGLNSLTHSGLQQAIRCFDGKSITYNYSPFQINEALEFVSMLVGIASGSLIDLSNVVDSQQRIVKITNLANQLIIDRT